MSAQKFSQLVLKVFGWKSESLVSDFDKCVLCVAPHTSNWDFLIGKFGYAALGRFSYFVIKDDWTKGPIGYFIRKTGGIGINRNKVNRLTDILTEEFKRRDKFTLAITPEGSRKAMPKWKKGFYQIALKAGVPINLVKIDYRLKTLCVFHTFYPTGDEAKDIWDIQQLYKDVVPKFPEKFILPSKPSSK